MPLTDPKCRNAKPRERAYKLFDGNGLYLEVKPIGARNPKGSKLWRVKFRHAGKESRASLGAYPDVSLREARAAAVDCRRTVEAGESPTQRRREQRTAQALAAADTFEAVAAEWLALRAKNWAASHTSKIAARLKNYAYPYMGRRPIAEIKAQEVLAVLRRLESRDNVETAHRLRQNIGQVMRYAVTTGRAEHDPTPALRGALASPRKNHFASVTTANEVGALMRAIHAYKGSPVTCAALRLAPLLFVRPGELRSAEWADIDIQAAEWRFIASKTGAPHLVPLASQAIAVLQDLAPLTGRGRFVFPGNRGRDRRMSENTINAALRRMGFDTKTEITGHGFRAMARSCLAEMGWDTNAIERQLAHKPGGPLGAAYDRAQYLDERRRMMQAWADYLEAVAREGDRIVPIKRPKKQAG